MEGTLFVIATPIGNLEDITYRAVKTLSKVDLILCEDTRVTQHLLSTYSISVPLKAFHSHTSEENITEIISKLQQGKKIALVSDAGTPGISDPVVYLIQRLQRDYPDCQIIPIPGVSALITLWSVAGLAGNEFDFIGFLPQKKGRETALKKMIQNDVPTICYESVHRIAKMLSELNTLSPEIQIIVGRELTKYHEDILRGTPEQIINRFHEQPETLKGEFTVIVSKH